MNDILDLSAEDYHSDQVAADTVTLSASIARILIAESPAHARAAHPRLNPDWEPSHDEKFDVGTIAHSLLLEGEAAVVVIDAPDWRTKAAQEQRDEAYDAGQTPVLLKNWAAVERMVDAVQSQVAALPVDPPLFADGKPERSLIWDENGVACRARLDWLRDDLAAIDDLKTTSRSANPDGWSRTIFNIGYDVQLAFYLRGLKAVTGAEAEFRFVVVETSPPYALSVMSLAPGALELANAKVDWALATWKRCLETDTWPAYPTRVAYAEAPSWEETRWLEKEAREVAA